ncbi:hypothetical protein LTR81_008147 [Elasticomyces elasticus]
MAVYCRHLYASGSDTFRKLKTQTKLTVAYNKVIILHRIVRQRVEATIRQSDWRAQGVETNVRGHRKTSHSMRVYLPPKLTGSGSRALEADAKGSSLPIDDSLHLNSKVSVERYCIYPSTYFQAQCQKESALPAYPDASLLRSPGVDRPKHVGTFEWIHMEQSVLNLFQFKRLVLEHLKVGPNARTLIAQNIDDFELDTNQPDSGPTFAKPHCKRLLGGEDDEQQSTIMLALPLVYLHDSKGDRHIVPLASSEEPNPNHRTLLQMLFPRMGGNVSEQQALYHSAGHSGYLHVTQLWCIMLNGGNEGKIEGFLNFTSAKDTKLYEACEKRTAAQAFAGPYGPTQSVQMPAASVDTADASTKDDNLGSKGSIESDDHGSGEVATENDLYRILMNFIWPLTHLFAPSYRTEGGSRASLKFWGAMQTFAIGFVQLYLARGVRLPRRLRKEDFLIRLEKTYAPFRLLNAVQKLLSYGCSREILVEGEQVPGSNVSMPQDFQLAYREVMLAFLHVTEPESAVSKRHFSKARKLLKSSFYDLLEDIPRPPLLTREAVSAKGLLALIVRQCTGSVIPGGADLITLFSQQITAMEQEVWSGEPSRGPLKCLRILRNELAATGIVLQSQLDVLETLGQSMCWRLQHSDYEDQPQRIVNTSIEAARDRLDILPLLEAVVTELRSECEAQSADIEDWRSNTQVLIFCLTCRHN